MKRCLLIAALLLCASTLVIAENHERQQGTIVRMRMAECLTPQHGFMNAMSGAQVATNDPCPEYVLVTDSVVYVIIGKGSDQLVPLAESTYFHLQNNEVVIRIDDARKETKFHVKEMALRGEWERGQKIVEAAASEAMRRHMDGGVLIEASSSTR